MLKKKELSVEELTEKAFNLLAEQNLERSLEVCEEVVARDPDNIGVLFVFGQIFLYQGQIDRAENCFNQLLEHRDNQYFQMGLFTRGILYYHTKRYELSEKDILDYLKLVPDDISSQTFLARISLEKEDYEEAYERLVITFHILAENSESEIEIEEDIAGFFFSYSIQNNKPEKNEFEAFFIGLIDYSLDKLGYETSSGKKLPSIHFENYLEDFFDDSSAKKLPAYLSFYASSSYSEPLTKLAGAIYSNIKDDVNSIEKIADNFSTKEDFENIFDSLESGLGKTALLYKKEMMWGRIQAVRGRTGSLDTDNDQVSEVSELIDEGCELLYREYEYDSAIEKFNEALDIEPENVQVLCNLSQAYRKKRQFTSCYRTATKAIMLLQSPEKRPVIDQKYFESDGDGYTNYLHGMCHYIRGKACEEFNDFGKMLINYRLAHKYLPDDESITAEWEYKEQVVGALEPDNHYGEMTDEDLNDLDFLGQWDDSEFEEEGDISAHFSEALWAAIDQTSNNEDDE